MPCRHGSAGGCRGAGAILGFFCLWFLLVKKIVCQGVLGVAFSSFFFVRHALLCSVGFLEWFGLILGRIALGNLAWQTRSDGAVLRHVCPTSRGACTPLKSVFWPSSSAVAVKVEDNNKKYDIARMLRSHQRVPELKYFESNSNYVIIEITFTFLVSIFQGYKVHKIWL